MCFVAKAAPEAAGNAQALEAAQAWWDSLDAGMDLPDLQDWEQDFGLQQPAAAVPAAPADNRSLGSAGSAVQGSSANIAAAAEAPFSDADLMLADVLFNDIKPDVGMPVQQADVKPLPVPAPTPASSMALQAQMMQQAQLMAGINPAAINPAALAMMAGGLPPFSFTPGAPFNPAAYAALAETGLPPVAAPPATTTTTAKNGKSPAEMAAAVERTKEKRRQSAQRSRQRKGAYIKSLEVENATLKQEVERLKEALQQLQAGAVH